MSVHESARAAAERVYEDAIAGARSEGRDEGYDAGHTAGERSRDGEVVQLQTDLARVQHAYDSHMATHRSPLAIGVQFHAVWERTGRGFNDIHRDVLTKLHAAGVTMLRIDTSWRVWEPTRGQLTAGPSLYGGKLDGTLRWCAEHGMRVLVTVNEAPTWAAEGVLRRLPTDPTTIGGVAGHVTEYLAGFGETVAGVEVWNEPSLRDFDDLGPRPAHYLKVLTAFHAAAKTGKGANVPIVFGAPEAIAVAPLGAALTKPREHFISMVYAELGGKPRPWDVMAVHCYPVTEPPSTPATASAPWRLRHLDHLLAVMADAGDPSPVWITEFGYSSHPNTTVGVQAQPAWQGGVTEAQQADLTVAALDLIADQYPQVEALVIYNDWEKGVPEINNYAQRHQNGFGILRHSDRSTTKPLYGALRDRSARKT